MACCGLDKVITVLCCEDCQYVILLLSLIGIMDCISDWMLYLERTQQIEDICKATGKAEVRVDTNTALQAMFIFAIFGTILVLIETMNSWLNKCKLKIIHPVFLSIVVCILEELPLAGLRWNLRMSANKKVAVDWEIASGIFAMIAPWLGPISKLSTMLTCCKCCTQDETCCDKACSKGRVLLAIVFLFLMACAVVVLNFLNWKDYKAPWSNTNGTWCG